MQDKEGGGDWGVGGNKILKRGGKGKFCINCIN